MDTRVGLLASPVPEGGIALVEHWLAGGEVLPDQLASSSFWTPEKKLAAAALRDPLIALRNYCGDWTKPKIVEDLAWVFSNETRWPYAFVPLCDVFGIDPDWVRMMVRRWRQQPCSERGVRLSRFRHAA